MLKITILISKDYNIDIYKISQYIAKTVVLLSPTTQHPYLVGMVICVMENNNLSLLMLHIWLVRSFMLRTKTNSIFPSVFCWPCDG